MHHLAACYLALRAQLSRRVGFPASQRPVVGDTRIIGVDCRDKINVTNIFGGSWTDLEYDKLPREWTLPALTDGIRLNRVSRPSDMCNDGQRFNHAVSQRPFINRLGKRRCTIRSSARPAIASNATTGGAT